MNSLRNILLGGILVVAFLLVIEWNNFQERNASLPVPAATPTSQLETTPDTVGLDEDFNSTALANASPVDEESLPPVQEANEVQPHQSVSQDYSHAPVEINTDTLTVLVDPTTGDIIQVSLLQHNAKLNEEDQPFVLLQKNESRTYIASLSLLFNENGKTKLLKQPFKSKANSYVLKEDQDSLVVDLQQNYQDKLITKRFTFTRNSYLINVEYIIDNQSTIKWGTKVYGTITRDSFVPGKKNAFAMRSFTGFAISSEDRNYQKLKIDDDFKKDNTSTIQNRWIAFVQHYFVSAWIPEKDTEVTYKIKKTGNGLNVGEFYPTNTLFINPGETKTLSANFYAGPKDIRELQKLAPHLDKTVDYGWLWFISKPLFYAMDNIHSHVGNWGIAIILITLALKAIFFYPSAISYRSMAKMRKVQPLMQELKERYGEDKQRMSQELMKLYKREKVNPLSGCLPILLQMPVFIGLYFMIMESVELRHQPFFLWIQDLSVKDPYFILPLLMGASMFIQQKLNPTPPDPMQAKIMQMLPIFFTFLFLFFPAGLVLYWVVNNMLSITQQYVITKQIENSP